MDREQTGCRQGIMSTIALMAVIVGCISAGSVGLNFWCASALKEKLPVYPGATVIREEHNMLTSFGLGETYLFLTSPDDPDTVHEWYNRHSAYILRYRHNEWILHIGSGEWDVSPAESGSGSLIALHGKCPR